MKFLPLIAVCLSLTSISTPTDLLASELERGARGRVDATTLAELYLRADKGDGEASYQLADALLTGRVDGSSDRKEGMKWLNRAVEAGHPRAQWVLGYIYETGMSVPVDTDKSLQLYKKAAAQNDVRGLVSLAFAYYVGRGVDKDLDKAALLYHKAAAQDDVAAMRTLGYLYEMGEGVSQNDTVAIQWYEKAAAEGDVASQYNLGKLIYLGRGAQENRSRGMALMMLGEIRQAEVDKVFMKQAGESLTAEERKLAQDLLDQEIEKFKIR